MVLIIYITNLLPFLEAVESEFILLREAYLPEALLAYINVLQFGGNTLTRDFLMECMELSSLVADEDSDVLELLIKTGRLQEVVEAFAAASKSLLLRSSASTPNSKSRKLRAKGWSQDLWNVR